MAGRSWTVADIPDQRGRTALVTGASNGIGFGAALELARAGAHVILVARDEGRGQAALARIREQLPGCDIELRLCDLGDLDAVARLADGLVAERAPLDLLINNAGVMMVPPQPTAQGHERHFGVNYLSHFALTMRLLPLMRDRTDARVVNITSLAHRVGVVDVDRLDGRGKRPFALYARSKMAMALFGLELDRRLKAIGSPIKSVLAHPGFAGTNLAQGMAPGLTRIWMTFVFPFGQDVVAGARPTLRAATAPDVAGSDYYGPGGLGELKGEPRKVRLTWRAHDEANARKLWDASERLTGLSLPPLT